MDFKSTNFQVLAEYFTTEFVQLSQQPNLACSFLAAVAQSDLLGFQEISRSMEKFFILECRVFDFSSTFDAEFIEYCENLIFLFKRKLPDLINLEFSDRLFKMPNSLLLRAGRIVSGPVTAVLRAELQLREKWNIIDSQIVSELLGSGGSVSDLEMSSPVWNDICASLRACSSEFLANLLLSRWDETVSAIFPEIVRRNFQDARGREVFKISPMTLRPKLGLWAREICDLEISSNSKFSEICNVLPVTFSDNSTFDKLLRMLNAGINSAHQDDLEISSLVLQICSETYPSRMRQLRNLAQWAMSAFQPGKTSEQILLRLVRVANFYPDFSIARLHRQICVAAPIDAAAVVEVAEAGGFSTEFFLRNVLHSLQVSGNSLEISRVFYACAFALTAVGDLAFLSLSPEKISSAFSEEQRMEAFEQLRLRDLVKRLATVEISRLTTDHLVDLLWALAACRISHPEFQESIFLDISTRKDVTHWAKYFWASAMIRGTLPKQKFPDLKSFDDSDLINLGFASVVSNDLENSSRISEELSGRLATLKPYQLHYALRFFTFQENHTPEVSRKFIVAMESLKGKKDVARRPQWKQAMQVSLATHGVFGSSVEVSPSLCGILPVDAFHAKSAIVIDVDRPLCFIRDVDARLIKADAYLEISRRVLSLRGIGSGPLRVVNIRLKEWTAVPPGEIGAQVKFIRDVLRPFRARE